MRIGTRGTFIRHPIAAEFWNGTTRFGGVASASSDEYLPVVGMGTRHPIGLSLQAAMMIGCGWKVGEADVIISGDVRIYTDPMAGDYFEFSWPDGSICAIGERIIAGTSTSVECTYVPAGRDWWLKHQFANSGIFGLSTQSPEITGSITAALKSFTGLGGQSELFDPDDMSASFLVRYNEGRYRQIEVIAENVVSDATTDRVHPLNFLYDAPLLSNGGLIYPRIEISCETCGSLNGAGSIVGGSASLLGEVITLYRQPTIPDVIEDTTLTIINLRDSRFHQYDPGDGIGPIWSTNGVKLRPNY